MKLFNKIRNIMMNEKYMFYIFLFILIVPNIALDITEQMPVVAKIANVFFPFSVYYLVFRILRNSGTAFWSCFVFIFLGAFQLVLLYLFGRSIIAVDMFLNLLTTNANEAMELLDNLLPAIIIVVLLYVPALILAVIYIIKKKITPIEVRKKNGYAILLLGILSLVTAYIFIPKYTVRDDIFPINVCQNFVYALDRNNKTLHYKQTSEHFRFNAKSTHGTDDPEIYVMVIGETSRADNWSLFGYSRPTNPQLSKVQGIIPFPHVLSESNTTHKSVPMLLSSLSALDFDSIYYTKGVFEAFNESGFKTAFFSNQMRNHSFIDFFGEQAQQHKFIKDDVRRYGEIISDEELLKYVADELKEFPKENKKLFIVLHTYGSHFNYKERYKSQYAMFKPDEPMDAEYKCRNSLLNAYDNSIVQTDAFLYKLIKLIQDKKAISAVYYTSDHGEDIFDDDRHLFLHASPIPTFYQLHVPMFVWFSQDYMSRFPEVAGHARNNSDKFVDSSLSFFYTMLDIAGINIYNDRKNVSIINGQYQSPNPIYLNDHNKGLTLKEAGWESEDFDYARKKGIDILSK